MAIKCEEKLGHLSIAFVEQLDVVCLDGVEEHEDNMTVCNE